MGGTCPQCGSEIPDFNSYETICTGCGEKITMDHFVEIKSLGHTKFCTACNFEVPNDPLIENIHENRCKYFLEESEDSSEKLLFQIIKKQPMVLEALTSFWKKREYPSARIFSFYAIDNGFMISYAIFIDSIGNARITGIPYFLLKREIPIIWPKNAIWLRSSNDELAETHAIIILFNDLIIFKFKTENFLEMIKPPELIKVGFNENENLMLYLGTEIPYPTDFE